ncbi:MAG: carbohydrate ABC transporter permease [Eubacteriales bacterium]|nr:carbohydrate ABC transporter permease [Eubacteriales bacterium]
MTTTTVRMHSVKRRKRVTTTVYHVLVTAASLMMLYPLFWMLSSSFKPNAEIFVTVGNLIPETFTTENYINGWRGFAGLSFGVYFRNSLIVATLSSLGAVISSAMVGFGLARLHFPGRNAWFVAMIITMMLPGQVMMIPRFVLFNRMGWVGTFLPLTVPAFFGSAFDIFLVMQFIRGIPRDLDEAARIDGCSWYGIFVYILIPMIIPALVTVGILTFINAWGDFMGSLLYLNEPSMYTVAYALKLFSDSAGTDFGATFAMSVLSLVPILIIFFFFQKQLVEGISTQGLKG